MVRVAGKTNDAIYKKLMLHSIETCNRLKLILPDFTQIPPNERKKLQDMFGRRLPKTFKKYKQRFPKLMEKIQSDCVEMTTGRGNFYLLGGQDGIPFESYVVALDRDWLPVLLEKSTLSDWTYPNSPMFPTFFRDTQWYLKIDGDLEFLTFQVDQDEFDRLNEGIGLCLE